MASHESPATADAWQVVSTPKGKQFRYAKAGLATEYPLDKAPATALG